jgi:beta-glucosidase
MKLALVFTMLTMLTCFGPRAVQAATPTPGNPAVEQRVDSVLAKMTLEEKILLLSGGKDGFSTQPIPRLGIPRLKMADGPQGVRNYGKACAFPCGAALAATWDVALAERMGRALGLEGRARGVHIQLGPGVNICRVPVCGRNFEYLGEDPYLTGRIVASWVRGIQSEGVAATVKHFACNNQERKRGTVSVQVDERTLREIYLPGFEAAVRPEEGGAWAIMSAYNRVNGVYCCSSDFLQKQALKHDWGFPGVVMSDWGACHATDAIAKGMDLEMPKGTYCNLASLKKALQSGEVKQADIDGAVRRILRLTFAMGFADAGHEQKRAELPLDSKDSAQAALEVARSALVLLKNKANLLPLDRSKVKRVAVYGPNAVKTPYGGGGSGAVTPFHSVDFADGIRKAAGDGVKVTVVPWFVPDPDPTEKNVAPFDPAPAKEADAVVICAGLNQHLEAEAKDRNFELPADQQELIRAVAAVNPHTVVVLNAGAGVGMLGWIDGVDAVFHAWYLGQEGGTALGEALFGDINPSGHLCDTFDRRFEDNPAAANYPGSEPPGGDPPFPVVSYKEGIFVGYRGYDKAGKAPLFPFGHGLSYTTFEMSNLRVGGVRERAIVYVRVTNTGKRAGAEVVQIYVGQKKCSVERPLRELKGFAKVMLKPGESKTVEIPLVWRAFTFWSPTLKTWTVEPGVFTIEAAESARDIRLTDTISWPFPPPLESGAEPAGDIRLTKSDGIQ